MAARQKKKPDGICKFPDCNKKATSRWNCPTCRKACEAMVERGEVTDEFLVEKGWVAPPKKKGRTPNSPAVLAVAAALAK